MNYKLNKKYVQHSLTNSSNSPIVDKLPGTKGEVLEGEILKLLLPCLEAIVGKEHNGSIIPVKKKALAGLSRQK